MFGDILSVRDVQASCDLSCLPVLKDSDRNSCGRRLGVRICIASLDTTPGQSLGRLLVFEFTCLSVRGEATVLDDDSDCFTLKYTRLYFQCSVSLFPVCLVDVRCGL